MYLITGATGFVGRALTLEMTRRRLPFRALSRSGGPGVEAVGHIDGNFNWAPFLGGIDCVVHLAARVHVLKDTALDSLDAYRSVNVGGARALIAAAAEMGVGRVVYVSSIKVNGERTFPNLPFRAVDHPKPQDAYGISKHEAEIALLARSQSGPTKATIIRPPLVYGPGVKANFWMMMKWMHRGVPLPLGAVNNARSLIFVGNLVDLILAASRHSSAAGKTLLASDGEDVSTTELLQRVARSVGRKAHLFPVPPTVLRAAAELAGKGETVRRLLDSLQVDVAETKSLLSWSPPFTLQEGLEATGRTFLEDLRR